MCQGCHDKYNKHMARILKTKVNPFGLSYKQWLVVKDIANTIRLGAHISMTDSHMKIYNPKNKNTAASMAYENLRRPNFREALLCELEYQGVLGVSGKMQQVLSEGLSAVQVLDSGQVVPDYRARLKYIQEIKNE